MVVTWPQGFPGGSRVKNPPANAEDMSSIPGLGRCPGGGNGNPLQYSCLGNPTERGAWQATAHGATKKSDTTQQLTMWPQPYRANGQLQGEELVREAPLIAIGWDCLCK